MRTSRKDHNSRKLTPNSQQPVKSTSKSFRMNARKFLLTYSQVPEGLTRESAIDQLQEKTGIKEYAISEEPHSENGRHFHVLLLSNKKLDIRSASKFDIEFESRRYHCDIKPVRNLAGAVRYVCKDKLYSTNLKHIYNGELQPLEKLLPAMAEIEGQRTPFTFSIKTYAN